MMSGILSPAFLQAAGQAGKKKENVLTFKGGSPDPIIAFLSCDGDITITSTKNGQQVTATYSNLAQTEVSVQSDANSLITIVGSVTLFSVSDDVSWYDVTEIDTKRCLSLKDLSIISCENLTSLDVSKNTALESLSCVGSPIASLDVSKNTALTYLDFSGAAVSSIDLQSLVALESLFCSDCVELTSLDVSNNVALKDLECINCTALTSLDLSKNTSLELIRCDGCSAVELIKYPATNENVSAALNTLMRANTAGGTVYTDLEADYYDDLIDGVTPNWTIEKLPA